jgi:hypothetical protein
MAGCGFALRVELAVLRLVLKTDAETHDRLQLVPRETLSVGTPSLFAIHRRLRGACLERKDVEGVLLGVLGGDPGVCEELDNRLDLIRLDEIRKSAHTNTRTNIVL